MNTMLPHQQFDSKRRTWHITFGTYGTRLHGAGRPTVDKKHNQKGTQFVARDCHREQEVRDLMKSAPRYLTGEQRQFVEAGMPSICERGSWGYRICAAATDHIHLLCDVLPETHGEKVRRLIKRWLGQHLAVRWPLEDGASWWAEGGSNIAIYDEAYLNNCLRYIHRQRMTA